MKSKPAEQRIDDWGVVMLDAGHGLVETSGKEGQPFGLWLKPQFKENIVIGDAYLARPNGKWHSVAGVLDVNNWNHITYVFDFLSNPHRADIYVKGIKVDSFVPQFDGFRMLGNHVNIGLINTWNDVDNIKDGYWGTAPVRRRQTIIFTSRHSESEGLYSSIRRGTCWA